MTDAADEPRVVVGLDGSAGSKAAMSFALDEARMRGAVLNVVYAYDTPTLIDVIPPPDYLGKLLVKAGAELDAMVSKELEGVPDPPVIRQTLVTDPAAVALITASKGAVMLVIGSRGHGGFRELLLGSTSHQCVHHAFCPVTVVRHAE